MSAVPPGTNVATAAKTGTEVAKRGAEVALRSSGDVAKRTNAEVARRTNAEVARRAAAEVARQAPNTPEAHKAIAKRQNAELAMAKAAAEEAQQRNESVRIDVRPPAVPVPAAPPAPKAIDAPKPVTYPVVTAGEHRGAVVLAKKTNGNGELVYTLRTAEGKRIQVRAEKALRTRALDARGVETYRRNVAAQRRQVEQWRAAARQHGGARAGVRGETWVFPKMRSNLLLDLVALAQRMGLKSQTSATAWRARGQKVDQGSSRVYRGAAAQGAVFSPSFGRAPGTQQPNQRIYAKAERIYPDAKPRYDKAAAIEAAGPARSTSAPRGTTPEIVVEGAGSGKAFRGPKLDVADMGTKEGRARIEGAYRNNAGVLGDLLNHRGGLPSGDRARDAALRATVAASNDEGFRRGEAPGKGLLGVAQRSRREMGSSTASDRAVETSAQPTGRSTAETPAVDAHSVAPPGGRPGGPLAIEGPKSASATADAALPGLGNFVGERAAASAAQPAAAAAPKQPVAAARPGAGRSGPSKGGGMGIGL